MKAWDVYRRLDDRKPIDTVFYDDDCDAEWVFRGVTEHDGMDVSFVHCRKTGEHYPKEV